MNYRDYMQSEAWQLKRMKRLTISHGQCAACGFKSISNDIHHLTYARLGDEDMEDLMPLCRPHHDIIEKLIRDGKLPRVGNVQFLATETIRLILTHQPRPVYVPRPNQPAAPKPIGKKKKWKQFKRKASKAQNGPTSPRSVYQHCRGIEAKRRAAARCEDERLFEINKRRYATS